MSRSSSINNLDEADPHSSHHHRSLHHHHHHHSDYYDRRDSRSRDSDARDRDTSYSSRDHRDYYSRGWDSRDARRDHQRYYGSARGECWCLFVLSLVSFLLFCVGVLQYDMLLFIIIIFILSVILFLVLMFFTIYSCPLLCSFCFVPSFVSLFWRACCPSLLSSCILLPPPLILIIHLLSLPQYLPGSCFVKAPRSKENEEQSSLAQTTS